MELKLPELGENIETVDVSAVLVAEGDEVRRDQPVIEVETEKASLEVPSSVDGRVKQLLVSKGDKLSVGQVILVIETEPGAEEEKEEEEAAGQAEGGKQKKRDTKKETDKKETEKEEEEGARPAARRSAPRPSAAGPARKEPEKNEPEEKAPKEMEEEREEEEEAAAPRRADVVAFPSARGPVRAEIGRTVPAAPSVRALARELGLDIYQVAGSGPGGRITREDVKAHAKQLIDGSGAVAQAAAAPAAQVLPDFSDWGEVEREPLAAVRRATARNLAQSWATIPHVTQFDRADVTALEELRRGFNERREGEGPKLTVTAFAVKVAAVALRRFPKFNASLDVAGQAIVYKRFYNVGVAVDTERGLLVPVIRGAERKSLLEVAGELEDLAESARRKRLRPEQMQGATFTISNLGGLGTTWFSPIVNWPEVAILGLGRAETQAVHRAGAFEPRLILPLSVSYDHRLIDGADAARFLRWIAEALEQPLGLLLDADR